MDLLGIREFARKDVHCSLHETSKDTSKVNVEYMTRCQGKVINFDVVKTNYCNSIGLSETFAKSVDAIANGKGGKIYFIEFKNGGFSSPEILKKVYDSMLIFNSLTGKQINFCRENIIFVLVYNEKEKMINPRDKIAYHRARHGKSNFLPFGLSGMLGFAFLDVEIIEKSKFEEDEFFQRLEFL